MLLSELRTRFQLMSADDGTYWSAAEILTWINDAQTDMAARTLSVRESATIALTAGTPIYTLPAKTLRILRVTHANKALPRENEPRLDRLAPTWMTAQGSPSAYLHGLDGATKIRFYPMPDATAVAAGAVTAYVAKSPAALAGDSDVSTIPEEYHHALVLYALSKAFLKDGDQRNPEKAAIWWSQYLEQVELSTDHVAKALNRGQMSGFDGSPRGGGQ